MRRMLLVAPVLALLAALAAVFLPVQHTVVSQSGPGPQTLQFETGYRSLLQTEGTSILLAAGLPVLIAFLPLAFAGTRHARRVEIVSAALLTIFVVIAGFSIGFFYLPAALAAILVARRPRQEGLGA